jgi:hypothetical protein
MADYSAIKLYLQKNNLHYSTFYPNSEKPINEVIRHFRPDQPAEDISNSPEDLGFNIINERQITVNERALHGQTHVKPLSLFLVS